MILNHCGTSQRKLMPARREAVSPRRGLFPGAFLDNRDFEVTGPRASDFYYL